MSQGGEHLQDSSQTGDTLAGVPSAEVSLRRDELDALQLFYAERLRQAEVRRVQYQQVLEESECLHREAILALEQQIAGLQADNCQLPALRTTLQQHEAELAVLRQERVQLARLKESQKLDRQEITSYRKALVAAEKRIDALQRSASYRLGNELVRAMKSPRALLRLPLSLLRLVRNPRGTSAARSVGRLESGERAVAWLEQLDGQYASLGLQKTEAWVRRQARTPQDLAAGLSRLARLISRFSPEQAARLGRESLQLDNRPFRARWLGFLLFDAGCLREADDLLRDTDPDELKPAELARLQYLRGCRRLLDHGLPIPVAGQPQQPSSPRRLLYIASSALPYHISGYTTRTHALLQGLQRAGWDISCATRPGYPMDRADALVVVEGPERQVDGITYAVLDGGDRRRQPLDEYLLHAADAIEAHARTVRPALIQAASNYEAALPALIAARRLGIPFVYEVRGLWEFTAASKVNGWEESERFALDRKLEGLAASHADHVLTLTCAMAAELWQRGVDATRISLAPNAIHPDEFQPLQRDQVLAAELGMQGTSFVVGYIGSILGYEGLDDLLEAFAGVRREIPDARLLIVGDGDVLNSLRERSQALGLDDAVLFTGRVPHSEVQRYFSLLDAIALPRKPFRVCQLVSPLKPLEAMAMEVPMVVSDVDALREMVEDGRTALVHRAGDAASLQAALLRLGRDPQLRRALAQAAREQALSQRTWQVVVQNITAEHERLLANRPALPVQDAAQQVALLTLPEGAALEESLREQFDAHLAEALLQGGSAGAQHWLRRQLQGSRPRLAAFCLLRAAHELLGRGLVVEAGVLADAALLEDTSAGSYRSAARLFSNAANLPRALALCLRLEQMPDACSDADRRFISEVRGRLQLIEQAQQPAAPCTLQLQPQRVLNLLAFSLPYTSVGYATRSHGLALGIQRAGWDVRPCTRPGFPQDFKPELADQTLPERDEIDGVVYRRLFDVQRSGTTETEYLLHAVELYEQMIREEQPAVVHAASNYVTALPALIAARRLGVPFVYEVRGFWEVTRQSRDESFEHSAKYRYMQLFEALVACQADRVITITTAMREELIERGVAAERLAIAYNSVDPQRFQPVPADEALRQRLGIPQGVPVIGYIGSFVDYEGLDDLVSAAAALRQRGVDFRLLLVGDGAVSADLAEQVRVLGLEDHVIQTGRVPHDEVERYYSLVDIAPFPRKPWEVCELVSPLKPFEAMALEKAVVVSDTRALSEIVEDGFNGLCFHKGDVESLTSVLALLLQDAGLRSKLGQGAREWIIAERSWDVAGRVCVGAYEHL